LSGSRDSFQVPVRWKEIPRSRRICRSRSRRRAAVDDLEPYVIGSFDDVMLAYDLDQLTDTDYETLADAAAT
jgi:hypothetical protein